MAVVEAYAERFTATELRAVSEFFSSPAGSRLLAEQSGLSEAIGAAMESLVDENLERFVAAVDEGIAREFDGSAAEAAR